MAMYNTERAIENFAHTCFTHALEHQMPLKLATKTALLRSYDGKFNKVFWEVYEEVYRSQYEEAGLTFETGNIDDVAAQTLKGKGGFVLAVKNYDGDILSGIVAQGFGSHGLMYSTIVNDQGQGLSEANHGTVTKHYQDWLRRGNGTSNIYTNPISTIYAWTDALKRRGTIDENPKLFSFVQCLRQVIDEIVNKACIENGSVIPKDISIAKYGSNANLELDKHYVSTQKFMDEIDNRFK